MNTTHDDGRTNNDDKYGVNVPKREPARTLWLCDLDEWKQFQAGEITAIELKERYQPTQQTRLDESGGDDQ
jgi:hypothetical protein